MLSQLSLYGIVETISEIFLGHKKNDRTEFMERLHALGYSSDTLCNSILAFLVGSTVEMSQGMLSLVSMFLYR